MIQRCLVCLTCTGVQDRNIGEFVKLVKLNVPLAFLAVMVNLWENTACLNNSTAHIHVMSCKIERQKTIMSKLFTCQNMKCSLMMVFTASLLHTSRFKHWQAKSWTFWMLIISHLFSSWPESFAWCEKLWERVNTNSGK